MKIIELGIPTFITADKYQEWLVYRQALRDFPTNCDVQNPQWPVEPE
jgi:hypothetical protein